MAPVLRDRCSEAACRFADGASSRPSPAGKASERLRFAEGWANDLSCTSEYERVCIEIAARRECGAAGAITVGCEVGE